MKYEFDMLVIGGGAAGLTAAGMSAVLGAKTALVESRRLGGDCTWYGCVPSKSLLRAAAVAHQMRTAGRFGLTPANIEHDFTRVMDRVHSIRDRIYADADAPPNLERLGVEVIPGRARFVGPHAVEIDANGGARSLSSRYFVVATGSSPRMLGFETDGTVPVLTNEAIFELDRLPRHLLVSGAGPVGIEMAQAFQRLGSSVTLVTRGGGILVRDDRELAAILLERLGGEGIRFLLDTEIARIQAGAAQTSSGARIAADALLVAVGRRPNLESLHLEMAGVETNDEGIVVNRRCRSSAKHIYACGDVAGRHLFTHMAEHMAKTAVTNAILHIPSKVDERHVTWTTFTDPELAHVGANEAELQRSGTAYSVYRFPFSQLDRAITDSETTGLIKVLANRWGRILGVSILGSHAGEMIGEYALAMRNGVSLSKISRTIHPYPTYVLGNRRAADQSMMAKLTPGMVRWLRRLFGLRGDIRGAVALKEMALWSGPGRVS
jgi:pyruvate/2-oxoglutarate dehydrogenase complex dihydrolipoamide dehydrogenase (E3) component